MCGVAGIYKQNQDDQKTLQQVKSMISALHHRGPDGTGYYSDDTVTLGHARLSIIDLAGGQQPIHNENETVWTIFNGEIFNYIELRESLEEQGHSFYTKSDTEVIVHLYEEYGEDFVSQLNGQFSIIVWDSTRKLLLMARDRVGIIPLFFATRSLDNAVVFASEIKSILRVLEQAPGINLHALDQLMTFWSPVSPNTMFEGITEVSPGELVIVKDGRIRKKKYWDWSFPTSNEYYEKNIDVLSGELHDLLIDATKIRLRSDVPVGAYLSGGLDSSVLVALMHHYGDVSLRTFSISFEDNNLDESRYQNSLIQHLGTTHSNIKCGYRDVSDNFMQTIQHTELPILRTAPIPMGILSGLVHDKDYKVVLTGEGSDEVLGGYDIFKETKIRQFWAVNPDSAIRPIILKRLYPYLDITRTQGLAYLKNFFGAALDNPELPYFSHLPRWTTTARIKEFFSSDVKAHLTDNAIDMIADSFPEDINKWHSFCRAQYIEAKSLMAGYLLCSQGDRMLMKNSVEGRFPFLDHRVIEYANRLHPKHKMKVLNEKFILKHAMKKYIPDSIINRYKQPYRAPDIPSFFSDGTPEYVMELMSSDKIRSYGIFDTRKVEGLMSKIARGRAIGYKDNMAFVGILSTQAWQYIFKDFKQYV